MALHKLLGAALAGILLVSTPQPSEAAESSGSIWIAAPNDLVFNRGGLRSRFIVIESWNATSNYPANTILKHSGQLWVALADPAAGDEPGTAAVWLQATGAGGTSLSQEQVEDFVGGLVTRGTKTGITVTYVDDGDNPGQINFTVAGGGTVTLSDDDPQDVVSGAAEEGTSGEVSRADHVHSGVPAPATTVLNTQYTGTGTVGADTIYARQDHRHGLDKTNRFDDSDAPQNVTTGASAAGDDDVPARRDHIHGGDTNTQHTLFSGTPANVTTGTGAAGSSVTVARGDHVHGGDSNTQRSLSDSTPQNVAETGAAGSNSEVSREDHVHGGAPQPADSIVAETITATGTVGSSTSEFAREDHRHGINVAGLFDSTNPEDVGTAAPGTATTAARRDHVHGGGGGGTGDITGVTVTAPITGGGDSGDVTIGISAASTTADGSMSAADKVKLDGLEEQIELIDSLNDITYTQADTTDLSTRFGGATVYTADLDAEGTDDAEINDLFVFQWRDNPAGIPGDRPLGIRINDTALTLPIRVVDPITNSLANKVAADLTRYEFLFLSRQDGVFIQLSALHLSEVSPRLLPSGPTNDQIARYDSGTSSWVAEDLAAAISTFIGDTDTPNAYTDAARHLLRVNGTPDGVEFIPEPANDNTIPHVSRLPVVADDSPVLVFLTHDELDGDREDATLTVGEALGRYCGYSNGDIFQAFGAISKPSPIEMIFGIWDGTDCTIQTVHSANEGFIDDIRSVIFTVGGGTETTCNLGSAFQEYGYETKRILSCPGLEDIATGDVTINFLYSDGTSAYWTDGSRAHRAGLYEKTGTPSVYHDLAPPEDAHKTGEGSAACGDSEPPDAAGQICVTSDGRGYFAMPRTELETTPATISVAAAGSGLFIPDLYEPSDLENRVGLTDGQFIYIKTSQDFYQFQDPDFVVVSWTEAWQYIISNVGDTADRQAFLASVFLGEFASEAEVTRDRDGYSTPLPAVGTATISGGVVTDISIDYGGSGYTAAPTITIGAPGGIGTQATATATITDGVVTAVTITNGGTEYAAAPDVTFSDPPGVIDYYFLYSDFGTLIQVSAFTNSVRTDIDAGFAWRGPVIIPEEVLDVVMANGTEEIDGVLDNILIGSQRYSVIVRQGSNGHLREPTAADYNANAVGFDGQWREVGRRLVPGHSASADDSIRSDGSTTAFGGRTYRYRDEHHGDGNVHNARSLDYYWDLRSNRFRWCYETTGNPANCLWSDMHTDSGHFDGVFYQTFNFLGYFESRDDALAAATASGQSAVYRRSGGWDFNTFDNVVTAQADEYVYDWRDVQPPAPDDPANVVLVDDLAVTFNAADRPSIEVQFARALTVADDGRPVIIDYRPNASGDNNRATGGAILAEHVRHLTTLRPVALQKDPPGGRNPIDHTEDLPTGANRFAPGHVEFPFPLSTGDNDLHWMRLIYIGDHIDDMDGSFGAGATTITVDNPAGFVVDRNYWIVGPISGGGCTETYHSEKVTVTAIGTPNADDLTVVRGLDGTGLANNCAWVSGADIIEDDKRTFILAATNDDQDSGDFTFTLLSQGVGGSGGGGSGSGGLSTVSTDGTLRGDGSSGSPLSVAHPLPATATDNQIARYDSATSSWLAEDQSAGAVSTDATIDGDGTGGDPLSIPNPLPAGTSADQIPRWDAANSEWTAEALHTGSSIDGVGTLADPLVVDVHDVIESLNEHIRWHTDSTNTTTKGATVCNIFTTGPVPLSVTHTSWNISGIPANNQRRYRARLYRLNDNNTIAGKIADSNEFDFAAGTEHFLYFDSDGVSIPTNSRVGVCASRTIGGNDSATYLSVGAEDSTSPTASYTDADEDWIRHGWGEYESLDPQTGDSTATHDTDDDADIYGEMRIYYKRTIDHGQLVGDGTVDIDHLNDDVIARILPASPTDGQYARYNATDQAWEAVNAPTGSGRPTVVTIYDGTGGTNRTPDQWHFITLDANADISDYEGEDELRIIFYGTGGRQVKRFPCSCCKA